VPSINPIPTRSYQLDGLSGPVEIVVDEWGIPHIYAEDSYDVFIGQGFNAARDRLWQIDFWRRRGLGLLSEVFGPAYVDHDRAARLFLYRGDMHVEWLAYGSDTKRIVTAFVEGINAYVRLAWEDSTLLPIEFRELGYQPVLWQPEDVARIRGLGLFYNLREEVARALVLRDFGPDIEMLRQQREPTSDLTIPDGLNLSLIPDDVLRVYDLATIPPQFGERGSPVDVASVVTPEGSNNWVLSGVRTSTGRPMLANDPHRAISLPSLRYLAHLSGPDFDVIGGGEPALPGISIGHNGRIAFGLTIFPVDQEDLYVYETNPEDPLEYSYQGRWEAMQVVHEKISVRDCDASVATLAFTRHGPVIYTNPERHTAFAVRAAWLEPGMAPYLGSIEYMRAENCEQFLTALNRWGAPPENQVYADTRGSIGWKAAGLTPIRPNWDGSLPVPGDGRYEWAGFYDMDQLPGQVNPPQGWIATANEMNLPADFPRDRTITYDWDAPYRRHRIDEVLSSASRPSMSDMVKLQADYHSIPARHILARLRRLSFDASEAARARDLLVSWDGELRRDSAAAALFEVWYRRHLRPALLSRALDRLPPSEREQAVRRIMPDEEIAADARTDLALIRNHTDSSLEEIFTTTLRDAERDLEGLLGTNRAEWSWGQLHAALLTHPLAALLDGIEEMILGPLPRGGSGDTVGNTAYTSNFVQSTGSTFRIVIDVGNWDASLAMNSPGQSGRLESPHYADLLAAWTNDEAIPLLYTRGSIEVHAEETISLTPSPPFRTDGSPPSA
jgi:penicillin G amidase